MTGCAFISLTRLITLELLVIGHHSDLGSHQGLLDILLQSLRANERGENIQ